MPTDASYTAGLLRGSSEKTLQYDSLAENRYRRYSALLGKAEFRLLEVGCGSCGMASMYNRLGVEYSGIDIDPRVVQYAKESGVSNVSQTDLFAMPERQNYDVICFSQVLEHIKAPKAFLEKVSSLLTADGIVHCDVPNHHSLPSLLYRLPINPKRWGAVEYPHHLYGYAKRSLQCLFSEAFSVRVFDVAVDDPVWGQALEPANRLALVSTLLTVLKAGSLLVAFGRKNRVQTTVTGFNPTDSAVDERMVALAPLRSEIHSVDSRRAPHAPGVALGYRSRVRSGHSAPIHVLQEPTRTLCRPQAFRTALRGDCGTVFRF